MLYCYPDNTSDELLQLMHDDPKICAYIDIPLQHVHDKVLREMNRRGDHALIDRLYHRIRELGGFALRTTMIAGFPGETEEEFRYLLDYLKSHPFDRLGAFAYSREEGTPAAARKDQVPLRNRRGRANRLMRPAKGHLPGLQPGAGGQRGGRAGGGGGNGPVRGPLPVGGPGNRRTHLHRAGRKPASRPDRPRAPDKGAGL